MLHSTDRILTTHVGSLAARPWWISFSRRTMGKATIPPGSTS